MITPLHWVCNFITVDVQQILQVVLDDKYTLPFFLFFFVFALEADEGDHQFSQGQSMDHERWRKRQFDEMGEGRAVEGSNGDKREGRLASDNQHYEGDDV